MSTPPALTLPPNARRIEIPVTRGSRAAIELSPRDPVGTAVLVPGFTGSKEDFLSLLQPLADCGWRVVAYDQLGQWHSPGPPDPAAYSLDLLGADARDVVAWAATTPGHDVHLVGHSLGGLVARAAVLDADCTDATSLTLLCSGPGALPEHRRGAIPALVSVLPDMPMNEIWQVKEHMDREAGGELPPPEIHAFLRERFCAASPWGLRIMGEILLTEPDRTPALAAAGVAVHVVYGEHDDAWPLNDQDSMADALGATVHVIANAGHSPAVDDPVATADTLDRLWRASRSGGQDSPLL